LSDRLTHRSLWSTFSIVLIGFLMLSLLVACGSDSDDDDDNSGSDTTTTASTATTATGSSNAAGTATEDHTNMGTAATSDMGQAMAIGACLQEGTTGDLVTDLRDGNTDSAEDLYRECLSDALPPAMVSQLDPIIEQAGTCGTDAAADLSDADVAAIEEGDQAKIEQITTATLECLSADLGIDLQ
jgi:hypothetical protein